MILDIATGIGGIRRRKSPAVLRLMKKVKNYAAKTG
jgi:hypothetical protein